MRELKHQHDSKHFVHVTLDKFVKKLELGDTNRKVVYRSVKKKYGMEVIS